MAGGYGQNRFQGVNLDGLNPWESNVYKEQKVVEVKESKDGINDTSGRVSTGRRDPVPEQSS